MESGEPSYRSSVSIASHVLSVHMKADWQPGCPRTLLTISTVGRESRSSNLWLFFYSSLHPQVRIYCYDVSILAIWPALCHGCRVKEYSLCESTTGFRKPAHTSSHFNWYCPVLLALHFFDWLPMLMPHASQVFQDLDIGNEDFNALFRKPGRHWICNINFFTISCLDIAALQDRKPDCFRQAAGQIYTRCEDLDMDEGSRVRGIYSLCIPALCWFLQPLFLWPFASLRQHNISPRLWSVPHSRWTLIPMLSKTCHMLIAWSERSQISLRELMFSYGQSYL